MQKTVTYISGKIPDHYMTGIIEILERDFPVKYRRVSSIVEIFPLLADPNFSTDYLYVDVESLYEQEGLVAFDVINTIYTLIAGTVCRPDGGKPVRRTTKIITGVGLLTPINLIKEAAMMTEIAYIVPRIGGRFGFADIRESLVGMLNNKERIYYKIKDMLRNDKKAKVEVTSSTDIVLTARQQQIYDLLYSRGVSNKMIAKTLKITESTVKFHISGILKKHGVKSRTQLIAFTKRAKDYSEV